MCITASWSGALAPPHPDHASVQRRARSLSRTRAPYGWRYAPSLTAPASVARVGRDKETGCPGRTKKLEGRNKWMAPRGTLDKNHHKFVHRRRRPAANETLLDCCRVRRHRGRSSLGARKPEYKLDPGLLEHPRLSSRVVRPRSTLCRVPTTGAPRRRRVRRIRCKLIPTLLRSRRA
jgi:hypothetical protein